MKTLSEYEFFAQENAKKKKLDVENGKWRRNCINFNIIHCKDSKKGKNTIRTLWDFFFCVCI